MTESELRSSITAAEEERGSSQTSDLSRLPRANIVARNSGGAFLTLSTRLTKRASVAKKKESQKVSIGELKDMPLKEYTNHLLKQMIKALNAQTGKKKRPKTAKAKKT